MNPILTGHSDRHPSLNISDMQEIFPEANKGSSTTTGQSGQGHDNSKPTMPTTHVDYNHITLHNFPEEDRIAPNINAILPSGTGLHSIPGAAGGLRMLQISRDLYRTTPNGCLVQFADGSTQMQFPRRLYQSHICGVARKRKVSSQQCTRYSASMKVTVALFRTPIRYPLSGLSNFTNAHYSTLDDQIHHGRNTIIVQCAVAIPIGAMYLGPNSKYNKTYVDPDTPRENSLLTSEIDVARNAIKWCTREVATKTAAYGGAFTKIIVMTSSERVVRGITEFLSHWRRMSWTALDLLFFPGVEENRHRWESLDKAIWQAVEAGLEVDLWLVTEDEIRGAIDLAETSKITYDKKKAQSSAEVEELALLEEERKENAEI
ncbi:hypothetical protein HOY80DRAFT_1106753 [Tuber brumale]|nr:hypothetical protein HOY80DRAFT_1106753 [Tuber brumale]